MLSILSTLPELVEEELRLEDDSHEGTGREPTGPEMLPMVIGCDEYDGRRDGRMVVERRLVESPRRDAEESLNCVPREQQDNVEETLPIPILERVANDDGVIDWRLES